MKFSKRSEYALRAMVVMSSHQGSLQTIPSISEAAGVPSKFLEQILLSLRQAGLLQSRRGAGGGYILHRAPSTIRLSEIIAAADGASVERKKRPTLETAVDRFFQQIEEEIENRLAQTTLEDLVRMGEPTGEGYFEI